jgi:hypothetical protein
MEKRKEIGVQNPKMQFVLKGFREATGFRIFVFDGIDADRSRAEYTVKTDLALTRRYGIRLQELPLLCRALLERQEAGEEKRSFTYSEIEMGEYASIEAARAEAARKRKPPRRPQNTERLGASWRGPMQHPG